MTLNTYQGFALITALGLTLSACGEHGGMSPTSPSVASSPQTQRAQRAATPLARRGVDSDGDGYEDPDPGMPSDPGTSPMPNPEGVPPPEGFPPPEGMPAPVQLTIGIVGLFGPLSFVPNPLQAAIGNTIVWTNNDVFQHNIVLDDGTPIGNLAPGQSSAPISTDHRNGKLPSMTNPGPSAMALNNRCRSDAFCRRRAPRAPNAAAASGCAIASIFTATGAHGQAMLRFVAAYFFSMTCTSNIWRVPSFASAGNAKRSPARFHVGAGSMRRSPPS